MLAPLILASLLVVVVLFTLRAPGSTPRLAGLWPLRLLVPSWRFFDRPGPSFHLAVRTGSSAAQLGDYRDFVLPATRHRLLLDGPGNLRLAYFTLLERLFDELSALEGDAEGLPVDHLVSYALVANLVRHALPASDDGADVRHFQFKLALEHGPTEGHAGREEILTSAVHTR